MTGAARDVPRFGRFNLVGLLGAVLQLLLLAALRGSCGFGAIAATAISVELTLLHNFVWHERYTWRDRTTGGVARAILRLARFQMINGVVSLFGNTVLVYVLAERLGVPLILSSLAAIAVCALVNFCAADRWVYAPGAFKNQAGGARAGSSPGRAHR